MAWRKTDNYCGGCGCEDCQATAGVGVFSSPCKICEADTPNGLGIVDEGGNFIHACNECINVLMFAVACKPTDLARLANGLMPLEELPVGALKKND